MVSPTFEEYLGRIERKVALSEAESYKEFAVMVIHHSGMRWKDSTAQIEALRDGAERRGFDTTLPAWVKKKDYVKWYMNGYGSPSRREFFTTRKSYRFETVKVRGKTQVRYRDLKTGRFIRKPKR